MGSMVVKKRRLRKLSEKKKIIIQIARNIIFNFESRPKMQDMKFVRVDSLVVELQNSKKKDSGIFGANWRVDGWNDAIDWLLARLGVKEKQP